ncbi:glucose-methanol-choline oxidoreductase [Aspergillus luchuensis]|uniref:Glucose-methanol-choline oxidoreductase n=1 Tax=Aspergillus kawachii TaxID=1069201 RepID=A0A146FE23_ASPKA|nr:glucose-methanol-choline oxidoreductase [Aspergillus luchuensis]
MSRETRKREAQKGEGELGVSGASLVIGIKRGEKTMNVILLSTGAPQPDDIHRAKRSAAWWSQKAIVRRSLHHRNKQHPSLGYLANGVSALRRLVATQMGPPKTNTIQLDRNNDETSPPRQQGIGHNARDVEPSEPFWNPENQMGVRSRDLQIGILLRFTRRFLCQLRVFQNPKGLGRVPTPS